MLDAPDNKSDDEIPPLDTLNQEPSPSGANKETQTSLQIKNLSFITSIDDPRRTKLEGDFTLLPNNIYGLLGKNRIGKSLFIETLTTENRAFGGHIYLYNANKDTTTKITDKNYLKAIGFFPCKNELNYWLTGRELLILAGLSKGYSTKKSAKAADLLLNEFDLDLLANTWSSRLSPGNKKRLKFCLALVGFADFILIDDVAKGLDLVTRKTMWDLMLTFKECTKKTIILGFAHLEKARAICDCLLTSGEQIPTETETNHTKVTFRIEDRTAELCAEELEETINEFKATIRSKLSTSSQPDLNIQTPKDYSWRIVECVIEKGRFNFAQLLKITDKFQSKHTHLIEDFSITEELDYGKKGQTD